MTVPNRIQHLCLAAAALVTALLTSCSKASRPAPRASTIPNQTADGGAAFTLDVSKWVKPPTGQTLAFTVVAGGGAFTGSTYTHTFDTVGRKIVKARATAASDTTDFEFEVYVLTADEAVVQAGTGLVLVDRGTVNNVTANLAAGSFYSAQFIPVSNSQGYVDTFKAALKRGHVVYERAFGGQIDLFVFDPNTPSTVQLGNEPANIEDQKFEAKTSDNRVVFTSGSTADPNLFIYNALTGLTREISAVENSLERNAFVDANDIVYFERGPSAQRDIYTYNPATDTLTAVSTDSANEVIVGVVAGGGVVFTRNNGAGDVDLWFFKAGTGLAQIAADVATAGFQAGTLTFNASSPNGMVVFTHNVSGTDLDLYYWDPATQTTTVVATNAGVRDVFNGITSHNKIVYTHEVSVADHDIHLRLIGGADQDISLTGDVDVFQAITSLNDIVVLRGAGALLGVHDDSANAPVVIDTVGVAFVKALANGDVVYTKAGTGLRRWLSTGAVATVSATGAFAGETGDGNFVVKLTVTAQDDLSLWDEATDTLVVASADPADERFVVSTTASGAFVFSRQIAGGTYDLFVWDATKGVRKVSNTGLTHTFVQSYKLDNR